MGPVVATNFSSHRNKDSQSTFGTWYPSSDISEFPCTSCNFIVALKEFINRLLNLWSLATLIHKYTRYLFQIFTKILKQQHTRKWYIVWDFLSFKMLIWMHDWILEKLLHYSINILWIEMSAILQNNLLSYSELLH